MAIVQAEDYKNVHRKEGAPDVMLARPWSRKAAKAESVTEEEMADLHARLERRSAFRDR